MDATQLTKRIRWLLVFFVVALVLSGLTAFPLKWESRVLHLLLGTDSWVGSFWPAFSGWITFVYQGLAEMYEKYPFISYGTDWLAFAHLVIAVAFVGPLRDPVRNIWVIEFGLIACVLVIPLALICGLVRGIPLWWRLFDCAFGVFGIIPLCLIWRDIRHLQKLARPGGL